MAQITPEKRLRPRKTPRQPRAVETRARILDCARAVFAEHGYAAGTTNRIAEAAGLSVGSLYQYFPNKDAILVELVLAHTRDGTEVLAPILARAAEGATPLDEVVRDLVSTMVALHAEDRRLHQVLFEESPRPQVLLRHLHDLEDAVTAAATELVRAAAPARPDPELAARIAVTAIESLVHRMVATARPLDTDRFVDEVTLLITSYLRAG